MENLTHHPVALFAVVFVAMYLASLVGLWLRNRQGQAGEKRSEDFDLIVAAALTLLGLIIGFSFSMATNRYDERKNLEEGEADAIRTEFLRAGLLPASGAANVRRLLVAYLDQRIVYYTAADLTQHAQIIQRTDQLQAALWTAVQDPAVAQPSSVTALVAEGMNDVINAQGYAQGASENRIPAAAWALMAAIALICNALLGYGSQSSRLGGGLALVLPLVASIAFMLIADIDTPRQGLIRVSPVNLTGLAASLGR